MWDRPLISNKGIQNIKLPVADYLLLEMLFKNMVGIISKNKKCRVLKNT